MIRPSRFAGSLLSVALVSLAVVPACGDDDEDRLRRFCDDGVAALADLAAVDLDSESDEFGEVVARLEDISPPRDIADDWDELVDTLVAVRDVDRGDLEQIAENQRRVQGLDQELQRIEAFIASNCS